MLYASFCRFAIFDQDQDKQFGFFNDFVIFKDANPCHKRPSCFVGYCNSFRENK